MRGRFLARFAGYLRRRAAMHPSGCAAITGLRSPHHAAHAEACLHSATAAPAPSRFLRRRRRSTPQPLTGEPFQTAAARKASPVRGGGCAARRRRKGAAPCPANILLGRRILSAAAALRRAGSCCTLKDTHAAKRQCTPQSASPPAPLTGEPFQTAAARKASPARGGGCAARHRRRGAAPRPANILPGRHRPHPCAMRARLPMAEKLAQKVPLSTCCQPSSGSATW